MFSNDQILLALDGTGAPLNKDTRANGASKFVTSDQDEILKYIESVRAISTALKAGNQPPPPSGKFTNALKVSAGAGFPWLHLIYAYMIENTRLYELFGRVLAAFNDGESLGTAKPNTRVWLTTTEALFYRQDRAHNAFSLVTLTSDRRADGRAIRRNAYFRMFGMDLNHGTDDNKAYPYARPAAANSEFVAIFEALLMQVWIAITHAGVTTPNPTDDAEIGHLTRRLQSMLKDRRQNHTLTAEEFNAVITMDWLRLAISYDSPVVLDLRAEASSEHERIRKIAERVGLPAHGKSEDYLELSWRLATLLIGIEQGVITQRADYLAFTEIRDIIHHWEKATGRVIKKSPQPVVGATAA